jgi:hypothetical protein
VIIVVYIWHSNSAISQLYHGKSKLIFNTNRISYIKVSVLTSSAVDREFEPLVELDTKDYKTGICPFLATQQFLSYIMAKAS